MPELPEVETTRRGIAPHLLQQTLTQVVVRQAKLRYPIPVEHLNQLIDQPLVSIKRRAKYLLLNFNQQTLILHLGMSGSLRITTSAEAWRKHDHWQLEFGSVSLRYHDPRRFGFLVSTDCPENHPFIAKLGPEPLSEAFDTDYLKRQFSKRKSAIKVSLMNNELVVGIGNIYACESLFLSGIHPSTPSNQLNCEQIDRLHKHIQNTLLKAIEQGGSTLKDFLNPNGQPGYFAQTLAVYGRTHEACRVCGTDIESIKLAGRSSFYCPSCQPIYEKSD